jgi:hypothetical protein
MTSALVFFFSSFPSIQGLPIQSDNAVTPGSLAVKSNSCSQHFSQTSRSRRSISNTCRWQDPAKTSSLDMPRSPQRLNQRRRTIGKVLRVYCSGRQQGELNTLKACKASNKLFALHAVGRSYLDFATSIINCTVHTITEGATLTIQLVAPIDDR